MSQTEHLPLFPLGSALMPGMDLPLHIFEQRYRQLLIDREGADPLFGVVLIRAGREVVDQPDIRSVGTAASLISAATHPDGRSSIIVKGSRRFRIVAEDWSRDYLSATVEWLDEPPGDVAACRRLADDATQLWTELIRQLVDKVDQGAAVEEVLRTLIQRLPDDPTARCYDILGQLPIPAGIRQQHLEMTTAEERLRSLVDLLQREIRLSSAFRDAPSLTYASNRPINPN